MSIAHGGASPADIGSAVVAERGVAGAGVAARARFGWTGLALAAPATLWLIAAFAAPFVIVILLSVQEFPDPFAPLSLIPSGTQFSMLFSDALLLRVIAETVLLGLGVTALTAILGYPVALWLARMPVAWRPLAFAVILIPLLTNVVVRSLGIVLVLAPDGLINQALALVGIRPVLGMLYSHGAVAVALAQVFLPFMVLALYDVIQATSPRVHEAAESLGASPSMRFLTVDLPLSLPGLKAGIVIVFLMSSTAYVSATLLGGKKVWTTGMVVWQEALQNLNGPGAAALALVMTAIGLAFAALVAIAIGRLTPWLADRPAPTRGVPKTVAMLLNTIGPLCARLLLAASLALLLLPLVLVCIQSFNDVPQATVAGFRNFTWKWYQAVLWGGAYVDAFRVSVQVALVATTATLLLSLPAAFALARHSFPGLAIIAGFWMLPLSLPHVALGVGMLRLLQTYTLLPPFFGLVMIHVVLILPFSIALLRASVQNLDRAQEDAAASLGAGPVRRFLLITLPSLAPGLAAAGIVAFLLSFGEVTVTNFITTARLTTLPVRIYSEATFSLEPTVHAVSTLLIAATVLALLTLNRLVRLDRLYAR